MADNYIKQLAKRIVENSRYDKDSQTLFVTNPGISPEVLRSLAIKNNFKIGQTASGEYISIPRGVNSDFFKDKIISQFDNFMDTYTLYDKNYNTLLTSYKIFDIMAENLGEVQLIIDSYADEVLSTGFIDNPLTIKIDDNKAQKYVDEVLENNKFFTKLPMLTRMLIKYGNVGFTLSYPFLENTDNMIYPKDIEMIDKNKNKEIDPTKDLVIQTINPKYFKVNVDQYMNPINYETFLENNYSYMNQALTVKNRMWQPWQFCHWLIEDDDTAPYGKSILWSMRSAFDQLTTLEALLGISRASKIQRLVISIPMPNGIGVVDAWQYMNEFIANYNNSIFTQAPGTKAGKKVPAATEVLYKPAIDGFNIDKIESNIDLSSTEDVEYFLDKILRNSKLPKGYLVGDEVMSTGQTLEAQDLKFSRALTPIRNSLVTGVLRLVENVLAHGGFLVDKLKIEVKIEKPIQVSTETIDKYTSMLEFLQSVYELNGSMSAINRYQVLVELGMPDKLAQLICSNTNIGVIDNKNNLESFLKSQVISIGKTDISQEKDNDKSMDESINYLTNKRSVTTAASITNSTFNKGNTGFVRQLNELALLARTDKKSLKENVVSQEVKTDDK